MAQNIPLTTEIFFDADAIATRARPERRASVHMEILPYRDWPSDTQISILIVLIGHPNCMCVLTVEKLKMINSLASLRRRVCAEVLIGLKTERIFQIYFYQLYRNNSVPIIKLRLHLTHFSILHPIKTLYTT